MKDYNWDLSPLYKGLDDAKYKEDVEKVKALVDQFDQVHQIEDLADRIESGVCTMESLAVLEERLFGYLSLRQATDTTDGAITAQLNKISMMLTPLSGHLVKLQQDIQSIENLEELTERPALKDYGFILQEMKENANYRLSDAVENMVAKMTITGGGAWENLFDTLTSTLEVEYEGGTKSLSEIRNLANSADFAVRKAAYEAELASYKKIEMPVAHALNAIKSQVNMLVGERGYESALDEALHESRMQKETLDALLNAIRGSLDSFRKYMRAKAKYLGDGDALPFYDLFAPVGKSEESFTVESSKAYLDDAFRALHPPIADLISRAYDENWIDFMPKAGKVGGAFCSNLSSIKQSRVLTNFDGTFSAVDTLAHELGHAYHGYRIENHKPLNCSYSMPVAETASTFNETHLVLHALEKATSDEEKLALLEGILVNASQTIVDIYSRYLFESEVLDRVPGEFLTPEDLNDIMARAQKEAYGDALDQNLNHPYMWACKGHYYSTHLSFYNFPYAFGTMLSMGLYTLAQEQGASFMDAYDAFLTKTTVSTVEEAAASVGLDLSSEAFWNKSMAAFQDLVDQFVTLVDHQTA